jgi:ATP-binding cassette, subfamily C (CFTR/MRP), member 1
MCQTAWILNASVKTNITFAYESTFGRPVSEERYQRILDICSLRHDITTLANGDATEIGEKGINLSGGQKQV